MCCGGRGEAARLVRPFRDATLGIVLSWDYNGGVPTGDGSGPACPHAGFRKRHGPSKGMEGPWDERSRRNYFPSRSNLSLYFLFRSSTPSMYLMVLHVARAAPRMA